MKVVFTQNCTMSVGNLTVKQFAEGDEYDLEGTVLANALAAGRCVEKPEPVAQVKMATPVEEDKAKAKKGK